MFLFLGPLKSCCPSEYNNFRIKNFFCFRKRKEAKLEKSKRFFEKKRSQRKRKINESNNSFPYQNTEYEDVDFGMFIFNLFIVNNFLCIGSVKAMSIKLF